MDPILSIKGSGYTKFQNRFTLMCMYLEIIFSTKTQFKSFHYIKNNMRSLKNSPFCDILGAKIKIIYKVKQHYCVGTMSTVAQRSQKVA